MRTDWTNPKAWLIYILGISSVFAWDAWRFGRRTISPNAGKLLVVFSPIVLLGLTTYV